MTADHLIRLVLALSTCGYLLLSVYLWNSRNGPTWTIFKLVVMTHTVGAIAASWVIFSIHMPAQHPATFIVIAARLLGAIGNVALAVSLKRDDRMSNQPNHAKPKEG